MRECYRGKKEIPKKKRIQREEFRKKHLLFHSHVFLKGRTSLKTDKLQEYHQLSLQDLDCIRLCIKEQFIFLGSQPSVVASIYFDSMSIDDPFLLCQSKVLHLSKFSSLSSGVSFRSAFHQIWYFLQVIFQVLLWSL